MQKTGYYKFDKLHVKRLLDHSKHIVPLDFKGEPELTLGVVLGDALEKYCGVVNLGPFGCMPTRFSESVTIPEANYKSKVYAKKSIDPNYELSTVFNGNTTIPFLTIEADGNVFPQIVEAKIETFLLQAERVARLMEIEKRMKNKNGKAYINKYANVSN